MNTFTWCLAALALAQAVGAWRLWRAAGASAGLEARLARQHEALALLTETTEAGFDAMAKEIGRLAAAPSRPARKPSTRRIKAAAGRGKAVQDIAAAEEVSEGEIRLRLQMPSPRTKGVGRRASLRS